jgi:hypothetical protein
MAVFTRSCRKMEQLMVLPQEILSLFPVLTIFEFAAFT